MDMYSEVQDSFMSVAMAYSRRGEQPKISRPMVLNDKKYYEIIFIRKRLGGLSKEVDGRLIIDEQGAVVTDKSLLRELNRLFYYYSELSGNILADLKKAAKTESQSERDEDEYKEASSMLQVLSNDRVDGALAVKEITDKLPGLRKQAADVLNTTISSIEQFSEDSSLFTESELSNILALYEKTHIMSFERVKFINGASGYFDSVKREVVSRRRKLKYRIDKREIGPLLRLENILSFFIGILRYYGDVINYSTDKYKKLLEKNDIENIERHYNQLRKNPD